MKKRLEQEERIQGKKQQRGRRIMAERLSSFQYQQVNLEISFHTCLIVLIVYNSAAYFIIEDLELLAYVQAWT